MKWVLIIAQLGYGGEVAVGTNGVIAGSIGAQYPAVQCLNCGIANIAKKERSQAMDRDSCFKAAETVKKAFPSAEVSCEVVQ
jgi:hypothetical protein